MSSDNTEREATTVYDKEIQERLHAVEVAQATSPWMGAGEAHVRIHLAPAGSR